MSCPRVLEPVDAAHLETCADCRAAKAALEQQAPLPAADLERLKGPALAELKLQPLARPWWVGGLAFVATTAAAAGVSMQMLPANTVQHASLMMRDVSSAAWAATMVAACLLAVMPGRRTLRYLVLIGVAACFVLTLLAASGANGAVGGIGCSITEWAVALVPLAVALAVLTGFAFEVTRALAGGIGAMSAGMLAVHLHCPNGTLFHQAVFHLLPLVVLAAVALLLRRVLPSRSYAP
jgi:hypothetical protein